MDNKHNKHNNTTKNNTSQSTEYNKTHNMSTTPKRITTQQEQPQTAHHKTQYK